MVKLTFEIFVNLISELLEAVISEGTIILPEERQGKKIGSWRSGGPVVMRIGAVSAGDDNNGIFVVLLDFELSLVDSPLS